MEVTAIKIWWSASRGTAWPLEQAVELEEPKEAVHGEDLLIIRTPFNKLSPVIKHRKCSACSSRNEAADRSRNRKSTRHRHRIGGTKFSVYKCVSKYRGNVRKFSIVKIFLSYFKIIFLS